MNHERKLFLKYVGGEGLAETSECSICQKRFPFMDLIPKQAQADLRRHDVGKEFQEHAEREHKEHTLRVPEKGDRVTIRRDRIEILSVAFVKQEPKTVDLMAPSGAPGVTGVPWIQLCYRESEPLS